jgi:hypothetical protein
MAAHGIWSTEYGYIIPLNGKIVSGLHVEYNLQYLTASENIAKHNLFPYGDHF